MAAQKQNVKLGVRTSFRRADARRAGLPVSQLRSARFRRLFHDVYVSADTPLSASVLAKAALSISPVGSHASHHTAACIWGGVVPDQPLTHVSTPYPGSRSRRQGVGSHRSPRGSEVVSFGGLRVSSPEQTFIDLATELSLVDLVVLGDSLVRKGRMSVRELSESAPGWRGKGCLAARRAASLVRAGVDSPMETRLRLLMVFAGLPEPVINHSWSGAGAGGSMRFDLSYPELLLIIEYDGLQHAKDDRQYSRDIERREELDAAGWRIIVIRSADIYANPRQTLDRIAGAMRLAAARNVPTTYDTSWERHFPGR
jgi:hypothetical protein